MKSMIQFNRQILGMEFPWNLWMGLLVLVNMGGGLVFIRTMEGQLALVGMMASFLIMWGIYVKKGFVRLLGLGHLIAWTPQVVWYVQVILQGEAAGWFLYWLMSVILLNGLSLVIDFVDVMRYSLGANHPMNVDAYSASR
jgi:hypothetical protein